MGKKRKRTTRRYQLDKKSRRDKGEEKKERVEERKEREGERGSYV
jgi:hypothetical protein